MERQLHLEPTLSGSSPTAVRDPRRLERALGLVLWTTLLGVLVYLGI